MPLKQIKTGVSATTGEVATGNPTNYYQKQQSMNKILFKTLLLTIMATLWGSSAWAEETEATLDHTAGAQWGSNTGASTVDAEKEHYNNDASSSWSGCAYAKFSFVIPEGASITKAMLTYSVNQGGRSGRDDIIYYMAKDFDLDWNNFAGQTATDLRYTNNRAGKAVAAAATGGTGDRLNLTQEVTTAVRAIYEAGQNYIIFQWTGNAGGADLYGKDSENAPKLVITTTTEATYTVTFAETNGVEATVKIDGTDVTNGTSLVNGTYNYTATAVGYKDYNGTFTVDGEDLEVIFAMEAKSVYNYTVKAYDGDGNELGTVGRGNGFEDENVTYYYPEFVLSGTTLYTKNRNNSNPYWGATEKLDANNKEFTVTYGDGTITDVVFYKEAEEMDGFTPKTTNNATIRCSNGTGGISTEAVALTTLEAGKYKIFGQVWGTNGLTATVKAGETTVWELATTGSLTSSSSEEFELSTSTELTVVTTGGNDNRMLDLIYIVKTGDYVPSVTYYTLTTGMTPDAAAGSITSEQLNDEGKYEEGTQVTLTATANEGYKFKQWINGDVLTNVEVLSTDNPYTITMDKNYNVVAQFVKTYTLTVETNGNGVVDTNPFVEDNIYEEGAQVNLTVLPIDLYEFESWVEVAADGTETPIDATENYTVTMNKDIHLKAYIVKCRFTVDVSCNQAEGSVFKTEDETGTYYTNTPVTVTATPAEGYEFLNWAKASATGDEVISTENPYTFNAVEDITLVANFQQKAAEPSEDGVIFFADVTATENIAFGPGETAISTAMANITGGSMTAISQQDAEKNLIGKQSSNYYFCLTNNNTFFKVVLNKALAAGDVISANTYTRTDTSLGLFVSTSDSRPNECTTKLSIAATETASALPLSTYTVAAGDGLVGATTIYIYRETAKSTYFDEFKITRNSSGTEPQDIVAGDSNLDGVVTVSDAVLAVSFTLETVTPTAAQFQATDLDKSQTIDVADVVAIVNIILPDESTSVRSAVATNNFMTLNGADISLSNTTDFAGFQMDVTLADGAQLNGVQLSERASDLSVAYNRVADNTYRIIAVSFDKKTVNAGNGTLLSLDISGNSDYSLGDIKFVDTKANAYAVGLGHATGISRVGYAAEGTDVYTVGGVKSSKFTKGLNVVRNANGEVKKVYVK